MRYCPVCDKELTRVCALSFIRHGQYAPRVVPLRPLKLILERFPPDTLPASSCPRWITALNHKALDISMKEGTSVVSLLCKLNEVPDCTGRVFGEEFDIEVAER